MFLVCADNYYTRREVFEYCYRNKKQFVDMRAEGRNMLVMTKKTLDEDIATLDTRDMQSGSCQREEELEQGIVQYGNLIAAAIGFQTFMSLIRDGSCKERILLTQI